MDRRVFNVDFYEIWLNYQKYIKWGSLGLLVIIMFLFFIPKKSVDPYQQIEASMIEKTKQYLKTGDYKVTDKDYFDFVTLNENGFFVDYPDNIECNDASGVLVEKVNNNLQYTPYLICGKYYSASIKKVINQKNSYINLNGDNPLIINEEAEFIDPGYTNNSNYTVDVSNTIEEKPGLYYLNYNVKENGTVKENVQRIVILARASEADLDDVTYDNGLKIKLIGEQETTVEMGQSYKDLGVIATDRRDGDISSKVKVYGSVNTNRTGDYTLTYEVTNSHGVNVKVKRVVKVVKPTVDMDINYQISNSGSTNQDITITLSINSSYYDHTLLPNLNISYSSTVTYKVANNGNYTFKVYDSYGGYVEKVITVNNINKNPPSGSCTITYNGSKTNVSVKAIGNQGSLNYSYSDGGSYSSYTTNNQYTFNKQINLVYVKVKDESGNITNINCSSSAPTTPIINGNVEYHFLKLGRVDALLIRNGDHAAFVDGGWPYDGDDAVKYLKTLGITKLDFVIGSHSHLNHVGALGPVINAFDVGSVYFVENPLNCKYCDSGAYNAANAAMKKKGLKAIIQKAGDIIYLGNIKIECIAPLYYRSSGSYVANYNSLNQIVTYGNVKMLLTGDYMDSDNLLKKYSADKLNIDILKYPHHGNYSISKKMLDVLSPSYVIVQNEKDELGLHAASSKKLLTSANLKLYQNYLDGNIVVTSDGTNIKVQTNVNPKNFK